MKQLRGWWNSYKFRFVPWIILNLKSRKNIRVAENLGKDKIISHESALNQALDIFKILQNASVLTTKQKFYIHEHFVKSLGFCLTVRESNLVGAGLGVFLDKGLIKRGMVVSFYPGTIYLAYQPIFFQSIANQFIFKCIDEIYIDGNNKGLSKVIYKSCAGRDKIGPYNCCDEMWLSSGLERNSFNIGQLVNNQTDKNQANVCYQELDLPKDIDLKYRNYIPNNYFKPNNLKTIRTVVLVATRDIKEGEELYSSYYNIIKSP